MLQHLASAVPRRRTLALAVAPALVDPRITATGTGIAYDITEINSTMKIVQKSFSNGCGIRTRDVDAAELFATWISAAQERLGKQKQIDALFGRLTGKLLEKSQ